MAYSNISDEISTIDVIDPTYPIGTTSTKNTIVMMKETNNMTATVMTDVTAENCNHDNKCRMMTHMTNALIRNPGISHRLSLKVPCDLSRYVGRGGDNGAGVGIGLDPAVVVFVRSEYGIPYRSDCCCVSSYGFGGHIFLRRHSHPNTASLLI